MQRQEFVIVGVTDSEESRMGFGALLVATRTDARGPLRCAGKVGTGFDGHLLRSLAARLSKLERWEPPVQSTWRVQKPGVHWVDAKLVAETASKEWIADGRLRQPVFQGLREDKLAAGVVIERPESEPEWAGAR